MSGHDTAQSALTEDIQFAINYDWDSDKSLEKEGDDNMGGDSSVLADAISFACNYDWEGDDFSEENENQHQSVLDSDIFFVPNINQPTTSTYRYPQLGGQDIYQSSTSENNNNKDKAEEEVLSPADFYIINGGRVGRSKKFNSETLEHSVKFVNLEKIPPHLYRERLEEIVEDMVKKIAVGMQPHDMLRFHMNSEHWKRDLNMPFMSVGEFTGRRVLTEFHKINQSYSDIDISIGSITLNIIHTTMPEPGEGWSTRRGCKNRSIPDFMAWMERKQCLITAFNKDQLCLARALVIGKAHWRHCEEKSVESAREYKYICQPNRPAQERQAEELHRAANVPPGPCGIVEVRKFQDYLAGEDYRIYLFSAEANFSAIFVGPEACTRRISLLLVNNHYYVITSMTSLMNSSYFCWDCLKGYKEDVRHNCSKSCRSCKDPKCDQKNRIPDVKCLQCLRYFYGIKCLEQHRRNGTCNKIQRCATCLLQKVKNHTHTCGKQECKYCKQLVNKGHLCYIQIPDNMMHNNDSEDKTTTNGKGKRTLDNQGGSRNAKRSKNKHKHSPIYFYFDFEAMQETGYHVPNLVVVQWEVGGNLEQKVFKNSQDESCRDLLCHWIFNDHCGIQNSEIPLIFIAHYFKGYDGFFVLEYLYKKCIFPQVIYTGNKIMTINIDQLNIKFIDSFNFLAMSLAKFPATFQLTELKKGFFPHLFNTLENQEYVGPLPDLHYYNPDLMTEDRRKQLLEWHQQQRTQDAVFNMATDIVDYCISDVTILRQGCKLFSDMCKDLFAVDPFEDSVTIASFCQKVYRMHFMPKDSIAIIPSDNYKGRSKQSTIAIRWLMWMEHSTGQNIKHAKNGGEFKIGQYYVDGYHAASKTVYEFHGCFFHGCQKCYKPDTENIVRRCTMGEAYAATLDRVSALRERGYQVVEMWECEYTHLLKGNVGMADYVSSLNITEPLNIKDAFFGGRTSAACLHYEAREGECIRYYDYVSLYPTINKYGKMPVGHPRIIPSPQAYTAGAFYGFVKAKVLPPTKLYHPVLPYRSRGRLLFPLCRTCADNRQQNDPCQHKEEERAISGTWITPELDRALEKGYKVLETYEVWHFNQTAEYGSTNDHPKGLFGGYVDTLLKIKQEASGWPSYAITEDDKDRFIADYKEREGILLDRTKITLNPGLRTIAKLMLNSLWGKFGQRENLAKTEYVTEVERFIGLLVSPSHEVTNAHMVNEEMIMVTYTEKDEFIVPSGRTNLFVAAFTTGLARLKLYDLLNKVGENALYMDTDSILFKGSLDHDPLADLLGDSLGKVTDEIGKGNYIEEFVSGGPKNYAYRCNTGAEVWKVCGLTQNYKSRQVMNLQVIKSMVTSAEDAPEEIILPDTVITRNKYTGFLKNKECHKTYKIGFDKGVVDWVTYKVYPYGYKR